VRQDPVYYTYLSISSHLDPRVTQIRKQFAVCTLHWTKFWKKTGTDLEPDPDLQMKRMVPVPHGTDQNTIGRVTTSIWKSAMKQHLYSLLTSHSFWTTFYRGRCFRMKVVYFLVCFRLSEQNKSVDDWKYQSSDEVDKTGTSGRKDENQRWTSLPQRTLVSIKFQWKILWHYFLSNLT
jgi:hypothetical protein